MPRSRAHEGSIWDQFEARRAQQEAALAPDTPQSRAPRTALQPVPLDVLDGVPYVELHAHSNYSLLEGASHLDELVETAFKQGHRALALTDHDGMFGAMQFAHIATEGGMRPITGLELTVAEADGSRSHLTLLAETRRGYSNLCRLSSIAFGIREDDTKAKEARRLDPVVAVKVLAEHAEGVILLTGCREGRLAQLLEAGQTAEAEATLRRYLEWFGREQVFVELVDNYVFGDHPRNEALVRLAERLEAPVVGTGDVHYHEPARHRLQDVLVAIKHRKTLDDSHRERRPNAEFYLRSPEEQARRFAQYHPDAAANSVRIARRCTFDLTANLGYRLPEPPVPEGSKPIEELARICRERLGRKYGPHRYTPELRAQAEARLVEELGLIERHDLAGFFLVYHQVMVLATEVAAEVRGPSRARSVTELPPGRGRGSSVSSIVCYLIGLSHIDPVKNNLFIRRFLNEEMHSLPDIDLDFPRDIRARLIERVYEVWGKDHAALVAILPTYHIRSAIRDVGKALGLPVAELDRLAKRSSPYDPIGDLDGELRRFPTTADRADGRGWRDLIEMTNQLAGFPRHLSQHVGGMVISSDPLIDYMPCQPAAWPNRYLCHWDKDSIDDARMVKIDFLGLAMLSAVEECVDLIERHRGRIIDLSDVPFEDKAVYEDICRGDTVGVFQIESRAQIAMLPRTQPKNLDDLAVQVSIVRPGPIVGGAVNPYVRRREEQRRDPEHYIPEVPHECVREVLAETLGVVIFQEQVLQVCEQMGGFSPGEADNFRRAMTRRRSKEAMAAYREQFLAGAASKQVPAAVAERMFEALMGFAEFGFPKSHGTAFALLAYQSSWLKRYYAPEYTCGLFNSQPMGFYPPHVLTRDAQRHGVEVRRPDINASDATCTVEGDAVRVGLCYVQHVGPTGGKRIEQERTHAGPYASLFDFTQRTGLPRRATEALIQVGAFDTLGLNRRELLWQLGLFCDGMQRSVLQLPAQRQLRMALPTEQDEVQLADFDAYQRMATDYALLSLSPDAHPMQFLRPTLGEGVLSSRHLQTIAGHKAAEVAGLVVCRQRPLTARGIVFLLLEDEFGMMNVLVSRELAAQERDIVQTASFIVAKGELEVRSGEQRTLVATSLREFLPADALAMPSGKSWA